MAKLKERGRKVPPQARRKALVPEKAAARRSTSDASLQQQLAESRAQQSATAEILKVIARSPSDTQPVFDCIVRNAAKLCKVPMATAILLDGAMLHLAASSLDAKRMRSFAKLWPMPIDGAGVQGVVVRERVLANVRDVASDKRVAKWARPLYRSLKIRSGLWVPMIRERKVVGLIAAFSPESDGFGPASEALLTTFADQAVIAIENARAFNESKEALERQTATAEILKVIASSPSDVQPVFDAIAASAMRLFAARSAGVTRVAEDAIHLAAFTSTEESGNEALKGNFPHPISSLNLHGRAVISGKPVSVVDVETDPEVPPQGKKVARARGYRSQLIVPMLREGVAIGTIGITRAEAGQFTDHQIGLLKTFADQAVIAIENARAFNETKEALERQTATADILRVISSSPTNIQPVLRAVAESAARLCGADDVMIRLVEGSVMRAAEHIGPIPLPPEVVAPHITPKSVGGYAIIKGATVHIDDVMAPGVKERYPDALFYKYQAGAGYRTLLVIPMLRDKTAVGAIVVRRAEIRPFSEQQIKLLQTFADQAVIAIENVRLFNETREALERQTATSEVLKAISRTTFDLDAVLRVLIESATRLASASRGFIFRFDGEVARMAVSHNAPADYVALIEANPIPPGRGTLVGRTLLEHRPVHIPDALADKDFVWHEAQRLGGFRSMLGVPMMRDSRPIGVIAMWSEELKPFTEKQIELVSTFADQAVIAIENVRLFNETKESLERQTATAEILRVIASSPSDVQPVFDAIAASAKRLLDGGAALVARRSGDMLHLAGFTSTGEAGDAALRTFYPVRIVGEGHLGKAILSGQPIQICDIETEPGYSESFRALARTRGLRSVVSVPMLHEGEAIGVISVNRPVAGKFSDHQTNLLRTFASQAVIAIENVRLFNETREALERQTATAEILKVIASSPSDVQPVFDAIVVSVSRLFGRKAALRTVEADGLRRRARSYELEPGEYHGRDVEALDRSSIVGQAVLDGRALQWRDTLVDGAAVYGLEQAKKLAFRSIASAPLMLQGRAIGVISVSSPDPGALSDKQMELLSTFADQAVIAIGNVRLFNETKEALERQTATAEILRVIASSPSDVQPVFDAIVRSAVRLCGSLFGSVYRFDGEKLHFVAHHNFPPAALEEVKRRSPMLLDRGQGAGRAILTKSVARIEDVAQDGEYRSAYGKTGGWRRVLSVPMMREEMPLGTISVAWTDPGPIPDSQVELLKAFADQAVIAIQNVQSFNETKEALERQTATAEILNVIASSPSDVQPVFDAIAASARRLLDANAALVARRAGNMLELAAYTSTGEAADAELRKLFPAKITGQGHLGKAVLSGSPVGISDILNDERYSEAFRASVRARGLRSLVSVPMMREGEAIGVISVNRTVPGKFSDHQTSLLKTFADQAVIAIENVRLFNETKEALEQQTATTEILKVIASSPSDVQPVLDAIVQSAIRLVPPWNAAINMRDGEVLRLPAAASPRVAEVNLSRFAEFFPIPFKPEVIEVVRAITECRVVEVPDCQAAEASELTQRIAKAGRYRAGVSVPLIHKGVGIGAIVLSHPLPNARLTEKQLQLISTFADQAVIAIQNARLFNETKEALERQTATGEVLAAMSGSMTDTQPVFEKIVQSLRRLFGTRFTVLQLLRDGVVEMPAVDGVGIEGLRERYPRPLDETTVGGRAMLTKEAVQYAPVLDNPDTPPAAIQFAKDFGFNSVIFTPMIHEGRVVGAIGAAHTDAKPFDERQIALIKTFAAQAVIAIENVRLFNETKEALERQTATAEILKVIASSPSDVQPVFDAIAGSANRLIRGFSTTVMRLDGGALHLAAYTSTSEFGDEALKGLYPIPPSRIGVAVKKVFHTRAPVCISDMELSPDVGPALREVARARGYRSLLMAPLLREDIAIGLIAVTRREPGEFSGHEIDLIKTFADQAVIAIENVRLFNETREALERQTATAEILKVIASSPSDVQPVFDAIAASAGRLLGGLAGAVTLVNGDMVHLAASTATDQATADALKSYYPRPLSSTKTTARVLRTGKPEYRSDYEDDPETLPETKELARALRFRSNLWVPLLRDGGAFGTINISRARAGPFSDHQIKLLETFASQAVIAIENVRLFNETKEALQRQTATAEILKVIASSPTDVQPVFDVIVESAVRLCGARFGRVYRYDGSVIQMVAGHGLSTSGLATVKRVFPRPAADDTIVGRVILARQPLFLRDIERDETVPELSRQMIKALDTRSQVTVPMLRAGESIGAITMGWDAPDGFDDQKIALLQTFADQAVIAIENVRLFNETKEALEQQTATAEILQVISSSPTDTQPVFEAIVQSGLRLFPNAAVAVVLPEGNKMRMAAVATQLPAQAAAWRAGFGDSLSRDRMHGAAILDSRLVDMPDAEAEKDGPFGPGVKNFLAGGNRAITIMPMICDDTAIGAISVIRATPGPMSEKQLAQLRTFAAQAVIAIENVRLFNETKESLESQTATGEILKVIASSPSDVQPVFEAIVRSAHRLFARHAAFQIVRDGALHLGASAGFSPEETARAVTLYPIPLEQARGLHALRKGQPLETTDIESPGTPETVAAVGRAAGFRSIVTVPLLQEHDLLGVLSLTSGEVKPRLDDKQTNLLKTFADQAVIAIENVRLFNETKEALEQQTATAEILKAISDSPTDVQPVFEAIVRSGVRLFKDAAVAVTRPDGDKFQLMAIAEHDPELAARWAAAYPTPVDRAYMHGAAILDCTMVETSDALQEGAPFPEGRRKFAETGYRAITVMPMVRDGICVGTVSVVRVAPGALSEKQKALLRTFADQAVIAIENVRLFNETKEALEKQTATAEILRAISGAQTDLQPVFDAIARNSVRLCNSVFCNVFRYDGEMLYVAAHQGFAPDFLETLRSKYPMRPSETQISGRVILERAVVRIPDVLADVRYDQPYATGGGWRRMLAVPMMREESAVGVIVVAWVDPGETPDSQVDLLKTFADQAVIAIENVRLFNETKEALERQTATAEILKVISGSPTDEKPVFDAIVASATRLFGRRARIRLVEDGRLVLRARSDRQMTGDASDQALPLDRDSSGGRVVLDRVALQIADTTAPDAPASALKWGGLGGYRAIALAPLMRESAVLGVISVTSPEPGALAEKQMALLQTFADQAVIAIENVRLFKELQSRTEALTKSVGQLTALGEVGQAISSTLELETVLQTIVTRAVQLTGLDGGSIYEYDERTEEFRLQAAENMAAELVEEVRRNPIRKGDGAVGHTAVTLEAAQVPDLLDDSYKSARKELLIRAGYRAILVVPLLREDHLLGALLVNRGKPGRFPSEVVELLKTFGTQSAMAIQNARLFREIAEKGKQLEEASRHKSNFLASMSHELRTPLNAILGFNEMILGQVYGEVPKDMQEPLADIQTSGKHLLRLINNVLDLAKIEAGRMELSLQDYSVHDTVATVHSTLRPLAAEKGLEFLANVPNDVPLAYGDGGRIAQCLMNLAGNSLKFTKAGKVGISVEEKDGLLTYRVTDTGIGIPPDKIGSLFTEFKQTDATIASEYGGTGLGLSISKKFVEMHGGRIWVESELGKGSAFIIEVPLRLKTS